MKKICRPTDIHESKQWGAKFYKSVVIKKHKFCNVGLLVTHYDHLEAKDLGVLDCLVTADWTQGMNYTLHCRYGLRCYSQQRRSNQCLIMRNEQNVYKAPKARILDLR